MTVADTVLMVLVIAELKDIVVVMVSVPAVRIAGYGTSLVTFLHAPCSHVEDDRNTYAFKLRDARAHLCTCNAAFTPALPIGLTCRWPRIF